MALQGTPKAEGYPETPEGWARRWTMELDLARKAMAQTHADGDRALAAYRNERTAKDKATSKLGLFAANITTQRALLYGKTPTVSVDRRFADSADDTARVASEMLERMLNCDIEREDDTFAQAIAYALDDRLIPGLGMARIRYEVEFEPTEEVPAKTRPDGSELAPMVPAGERKKSETVETDYVHWKDVLWSAGARVWHEAEWVAFRSLMPREALVKRFGEAGKLVPLEAPRMGQRDGDDDKTAGPWARAQVWEVWFKAKGKVFWHVEGHAKVLEEKDDPLQLRSFYPCARPMLANTTTSSLAPKADMAMAEDLYADVDELSTRIRHLVRALRVRGVYPKDQEALKELLSKSGENLMIPVENWAMLAERGGLAGTVDWFPLDQVAATLERLRAQRMEQIDLLYQVTGMSDLMRGAAGEAGTSATEQSIKAKFGSVRIQAMQDEFARFASDLQRLKAEVIATHFDPETIKAHSNAMFTADAQLADQAVQLIKSRFSDYRIAVKPENVSLTDFAALKQERTEIITAVAGFLQQSAPLAQAMPGSMPFLLEILQWMVSGLRGASQIEGVLDRAIEAAKQQAAQPQQQQPDPKVQAEQIKQQGEAMKAQAAMVKGQQDLQHDLVRIQAEVQADAVREENQAQWNVREHTQKQLITNALKPPEPKVSVKPRLNGGGK